MAKMMLISWLVMTAVAAQYYEDHRCVCECPSPAAMINSSLSRNPTILSADVPPHECNCLGVVLPSLALTLKDLQYEYCLLCSCSYEVRNTTTIKVVVFALCWLTILLFFYLTCLVCLSPFLIGQRRGYKNIPNPNIEEGRNLIPSSEEEHERV